ncbi:hypothetical protein CORC01_00255 [Colletotrichum orchidophilum]|uniref:Uncharacterized protein n=1 Tax=Colletotrichum orchidophilum TaxID=1209926 RepID=A0A1G4BSQ8_9PEZI|nr:uncharacterized protein CORC01_00255 [Colletotrichum orchidophilum]OHF04403.1 hypothetical protein CORC01_00255 [Colletotrichum orchidophilum]
MHHAARSRPLLLLFFLLLASTGRASWHMLLES